MMGALKGKCLLWKVAIFHFLIPAVIIYALFEYLPEGIYFDLLIESVIFFWAVYIAIAFWRCAFNAENKYFGYLARVFSILFIPLILLSLLSLMASLTGIINFYQAKQLYGPDFP